MNVRINITLPEELEKKFREEVFKRYGMKKGNIAKAIEEAIRNWIKQGEKRQPPKDTEAKKQGQA